MEKQGRIDKTVNRTGGKVLNFQHLFAAFAGLNLSVENSYYIAIAVLACVFGAEIAGICILISKMRHARAERIRKEAEEDASSRGSYSGESDTGAFAAALLFGAVPMSAQYALLVLSAGTAIAAFVFVLLLIIFRAQGYHLTSAKNLVDLPVESATEEPAVEAPAPEPMEEPLVAFSPDAEEAQAQEAYTSAEEETPDAVISDSEAVEEEPILAPEEPLRVIRRAESVGQAPGGIPVYSSAYPGGQMPVVEKYITETYKEVIKETTTTTNNQSAAPAANEEILKAIAELMKLGTQLRMEKEMAVENPAAQNDESLPTFAEDAEDAEDIEEVEEEDELDAEEASVGEESEDEGADDDYESELFSGNERIVGFDEETGCYIVAHYRKSFEAKLIQTRPNVKKYYSALKNALLSYEGTKDRISWTVNTYTNDRTQIAKINVRARTVDLYLALDPASLEDSVYHGKDVGDKKKYAETPFLYKVNSPRKLTLALELIQRTCEEQGLSPIDIEAVAYEEQYPFEATEDLVRRGLIREYLREEKPAVTFELDPDHEPQLPEEDGSVIPANANFTWEFDNDEAPEAEEPVEAAPVEAAVEELAEAPIEETIAEAVVEEAIPTSTTTTTTHETIKTTERRYTERYYGVPMQATGGMLSANSEPIEALPEAEEKLAEEEVLEETPEELTWETYEEAPEEASEEVYEEETYEEEPEAVYAEETYEEEPEAVYEEEAYEEEPEAVYEEEAYEEEPEEVYEEETYEEESEEAYEEVAYEEEPEAVYEEEAYEEEPEEVYEEEAYEEASEEVYEEETYEEEPEEVYEEETYEEEPEAVYEEEAYEEEYEEVYEDEELYEEEPEEASEEVEVIEEEAEEVEEETPAPPANTTVALLDVCLFDDHFENGAIVNLETLKQVGLAPESAITLKVYASGPIKGQFTVEANHFTLDAIKSIGDADGDSIMIR